MKFWRLSTVALAFALGSVAYAQDGPVALSQDSGQGGQGGGRGWGRGMGVGAGSGLMCTVTEIAADHFMVKDDAGEIWTVHYSANTRIMKQPPRTGGQERRPMGAMPEEIKAADIKVGDVIGASGEVDQATKSVGAVMVMQLDPETAKRMREMQANYGKTWLAGRVTAINDTRITLHSAFDNSDRKFMVDENTSFRRRRGPATLADVQVGDNVRVEGALNNGQFVATAVNVVMPPATGGPVKRQGPPPQ